MAVLPVDLVIFFILTRLDVIDVVRCKSVCKEWRHLISTPEFEAAHFTGLSTAPKQKTLLVRDLDFVTYPMTLEDNIYGPESIRLYPFENEVKDVKILAHLDGLLCALLNETKEMVLWNPTTNAYTTLSADNGDGFYFDGMSAVGLYKTSVNDYRVLHIRQTTPVRDVNQLYYRDVWPSIKSSVYSRKLRTWRDIPFKADPDYGRLTFYFSNGTLCGTDLYFTVCECLVFGKNVVLAFDTVTECITEIAFPPVPSGVVYIGVLANVRNSLQMVVTTGLYEMSFSIWRFEGGEWVNIFSAPPLPPIPSPVWSVITHYMTNGRWFVMRDTTQLYEIPNYNTHLDSVYSATWFRNHRGTVYDETIVSPSF